MKRIVMLVIIAVIISSLFLGSVWAEAGLASEFKDVKASDWYAEAVVGLCSLNIIDGLPGGLYGPKNEVTRAQFVKMLVQAMGYQKVDSVSFDDIYVPTAKKPHWASVYIETALRNGAISKGETGRFFYPDVPLKRADMFMMMFRALKLEPSTGANPFADLTETNGSYARLYEEYLCRGIAEGGKRLFKPFGHTTRAEAAVVISRMLDYRENPEGFVARMAMEERFVNGSQTAEDIALKRELEIEKAKADPNYIMEPIITVEHNTDPWEYEYFNLYFENKEDYADDTKWKLEVVNYKQLNTYEMPRPNGTFVKEDILGWRTLGSEYKNRPRTSCYWLGRNYYTTQALIKDFIIKAGMKIEFKITVRKSSEELVVYKTVVVNDIKFKD